MWELLALVAYAAGVPFVFAFFARRYRDDLFWAGYGAALWPLTALLVIPAVLYWERNERREAEKRRRDEEEAELLRVAEEELESDECEYRRLRSQ